MKPVPLVHAPHPKRGTYPPAPPGGRLVAEFFARAEQQGIALVDLSQRAGYSHTVTSKWRTTHAPTLRAFIDHLEVLGLTLAIVKREDRP